MPISPNFQSEISKEWEINFTQCTPSGFLKYTDLCNLLQLTAAAHSEVGGISFNDMQAFNQAWVLSRMRVEISELPKSGDIVTIKTWINNLENSRSTRALEMYVNKKKMVGCETFWAVFNTKIRRPEALALPFEHFKLFPDKKATEVSLSKIVVPTESELIAKKQVFISDLDIVNHVNNVKYLEWCLDYVEPKLILNHSLESFEMNFMKELSLEDEISINEFKTNKESFFSIQKEEKNCFALQLNWK
ncbi:acyl-[acyl-carrier-protein] thioesterase [Flavobacterium agrisoli]|uniref:Acyl-[acyl-carrier-protein] thioesterase n=1 Tax=Flavobacterium agrisoli TaxID=2793066 RepID=A0A934PJR0_9FLAO|nr:acyl-ACP thioesterase domain-containing protein [Flavobacterium agrisoli]MBK0368605.1 acyl-[acyl-carrier-protein] thioesterase [Flavobacterium agrisoli]